MWIEQVRADIALVSGLLGPDKSLHPWCSTLAWIRYGILHDYKLSIKKVKNDVSAFILAWTNRIIIRNLFFTYLCWLPGWVVEWQLFRSSCSMTSLLLWKHVEKVFLLFCAQEILLFLLDFCDNTVCIELHSVGIEPRNNSRLFWK